MKPHGFEFGDMVAVRTTSGFYEPGRITRMPDETLVVEYIEIIKHETPLPDFLEEFGPEAIKPTGFFVQEYKKVRKAASKKRKDVNIPGVDGLPLNPDTL